MTENLCPGCGEPPATSREGPDPGSTTYRCANGHDWTVPAKSGNSMLPFIKEGVRYRPDPGAGT